MLELLILSSIKKKKVNTLIIGDSNACHYLEYLSNEINLKYVELHGALQYGKNFGATDLYHKIHFKNLYSNVIKAISQMPDGGRVILANRWQMYEEEYKTRKGVVLNVDPQYGDDILGAIIADIEQLAYLYPKLNYYVISQPVRPPKAEQNHLVVLYYLGENSKYLRKAWEHLGNLVKEVFKPENLYCVEKINLRLKSFADKHGNVYFIDRNIPVCKNKNECSLVIDGKPIYSDNDHLSFYGGEIVGKYILNYIEDN